MTCSKCGWRSCDCPTGRLPDGFVMFLLVCAVCLIAGVMLLFTGLPL